MQQVEKQHYDNLDGLRAYGAVGIVMMHVLVNGKYELSGFAYRQLIPSFTNFTFLFMMISAFSMCCGYYEGFRSGSIDLERFYKRRYQRIWPYFAILCTLALITSFGVKSVYEYLADLTLAFGLIPNHDIQIVGVGWFLGVVFVFYMIFPFFTVLLRNRRRACLAFAACLLLHILTYVRFQEANSREEFIYSAVYFMAGGIIYLLKDRLRRAGSIFSACIGGLTIVLIVQLYLLGGLKWDLSYLLIFAGILSFTVSIGKNVIFSNKAAAFLSSVSMEIYLSHMVIYRLLEKLHLIHEAGWGRASYWITVVLVLAGAILLAKILDCVIRFLAGVTGR